MSNSIDQHIVGLDFDTSKFDKGIAKAESGLKSFSDTLDKTGKNADALKSLEKAANSNKFSRLKSVFSSVGDGLSNIGNAAGQMVDNVLGKFQALGTAAKYTFAGITAAVGAVTISGGIRRAMNIEQARFQLKGLGADVDAVMENVNAAVKGTAYGLDAAAVVAAQLTASGVQAGEGMEHSLQAVAGVAAMTGREYGEIGHIFTTVAGQGQLMTMQLRQLEYSGLNAAAAMAKTSDETSKFFGKSEEEVREMVHQGEVSFEDFSKAMYEAFGEHAKDANNLFSGALANTKAALARIGAKFAAPGLEYLRDILNSLMPVIDEFNRQITPMVDLFTRWGSASTRGLVDFLNTLNSEMARSQVSAKALGVFADGMDRVIRISSGAGAAIYDAIPNYFKNLTGMSGDVDKLGEGLYHLFNKLEAVPLKLDTKPLFGEFNYKELQQAGDAVDHMLNLMGHDQREKAWADFKETFPEIAHRAEVMGLSLSDLNAEFKTATDYIKQDPLGHLDFNQMREASDLVQAILDSPAGDERGKAIDALKEKFPELADEVIKSSMSFADLKKELDAAAASGEGPFTSFIDKFRLWAFNLEFTNEQIQAFNSIRTGFSSGLDSIGTILSGLFDGLAAAAIPALDFLVSKGLPDLVNGLSDIFGAMGKTLPTAQEVADMFRSIGESIGGFFTSLKNGDSTFLDSFTKFLGDLSDRVSNSGVIQAFIETLKSMFETLSGVKDINLDTAVDGIRSFLDFIKSIPGKIGEAINFSGIGDALSKLNLDFSDFGAIITTVAAAIGSSSILKLFTMLYKRLVSPPDWIKGWFPVGFEFRVKNTLDTIRVSIMNFTKTVGRGITADAFQKVAIAIGILVASLWVLTTLDPAKLATALVGIGVLLVMIQKFLQSMSAVLGSMGKFGLGALDLAPVALAVVGLGTAILMMAAAVKIFSTLNPVEFAVGLLAVYACMEILVGALDRMSTMSGPLLKAAFAMAGIASVLLVMAAAVAIFGHMKIDTLIVGIGSIVVVLGVLVGTLKLIDRYVSGESILKAAFAMNGLASALLIMAIALKLVGSMSFDDLAVAIVGIGGSLLMLGLAIEALNSMDMSAGKMFKILTLLGTLTAILLGLSIVIGIFSTMGLEGVGVGLLGVIGTLGALVGALVVLDKNVKADTLLKSAFALTMLASVLQTIAFAFTMVGNLSFDQLAVAFVGLGGGLIMLGLAMEFMKTNIAGADAMTKAAFAILILAPALMLISAIPLLALTTGLVAIAASFLLFSGISQVVAPTLPVLMAMCTAFLELGVAAVALGAGMALAAIGLTILTTVGTPAILSFLASIVQIAPAMGEAFTAMGSAMLDSFIALFPQLIEAATVAILALLTAVESLIPQFINTGMSIILQIISGLNMYLPVLVQAGFALMITFVNSIAETVRSQHDAMYEAGKNLFLALLEAMLDTLGHLATDLGGFIMDIPAYLTGQKQLFADAGTQVATEAVTGAETSMQGMQSAGQQGLEQLMTGLQSGDPSQMAAVFQPLTDGATESMNGMGAISEQGASDFKLPWENIGSDIDLSSLGTSMTGSLEGVDFGSVASGKMSELLAPFQDTSGMSAAGVALGEAASSGFDQGAAEMVQNADSKTGEAVSSVDSHSGSANSAGYSVGSNIGSGIYYGIDAWVSSVANKAAEMVRAAKAAADAEADSNSPSKEMIKRGKWFGQGFEIGIRGMIPAVAATSSDMVAAGKSAIGDTYSLMSDYVRRIDWDVNPTIRPVLDLTDVQSGMSQLQGIMSTYDSMRIGAFGRIVGNSTEGAASNIQNAPTYNFNLDYSSGDDAVTMFMELASMMQSFNRLEA